MASSEGEGHENAHSNATIACSRTSTGHPITVAFCTARPTAISHFSVHCPGLQLPPDDLSLAPKAIATDADLVLLRVPLVPKCPSPSASSSPLVCQELRLQLLAFSSVGFPSVSPGDSAVVGEAVLAGCRSWVEADHWRRKAVAAPASAAAPSCWDASADEGMAAQGTGCGTSSAPNSPTLPLADAPLVPFLFLLPPSFSSPLAQRNLARPCPSNLLRNQIPSDSHSACHPVALDSSRMV
ncbi:hypothetical protein EJB05_54515, partial [Eragrostis curvula]